MLIPQGNLGASLAIVEALPSWAGGAGAVNLSISKNGGAFAAAVGTATVALFGPGNVPVVTVVLDTVDLNVIGQLVFAIDSALTFSAVSAGDYQIVSWNPVSGDVATVLGSVASVTGNVGGSVAGSVASVTGNVFGSVQGSVVGLVGGVSGNVNGDVSGNVVGDVVGNVRGHAASVTGDVGGSVLGTVALAPDGLDLVAVEAGLNARQALAVIAASDAGVDTGSSATDYVYAGAGVATVRIRATLAAGKRSAVTLTPPP